MEIPSKILYQMRVLASSIQPVDGSRHAAALIHRKTPLIFGVNKRKSHPKVLELTKNNNLIYIHAEMDVLFKAMNLYSPQILRQSKLYVIRLSATKELKYSKPCKYCLKLINSLNIKKVVHS